MKIKFIIPFFFLSNWLAAQKPVIRLSANFGEYKITEEATFWRDDTQTSTIEEVFSKQQEFRRITNANILTGIVKHRGWIRFDLFSETTQDILLEIQNPILDSLKIYQVVDKQIVRRIEHLHKSTPLENRSIRARTFTERLKLIGHKNNTIFICHDVGYALSTTPLKVWQEKAFIQYTESKNQYNGIFYGILILCTISCLLVGFLLNIRLFIIFGLNVLVLIIHFLQMSGILYQSLPRGFISNDVYNLDLLLIYSPFLVHILFVRGLTRIDEHRFSFIRRLYRIIVGFSVTYFAFTIFVPVWIQLLPPIWFKIIKYVAIFSLPLILVYFFFALYSSLKRTPFIKFYLVASLVGMLTSIIIFLNNGFFSIHYEINYDTLKIGILLVILIIFVGLLFQVREHFTTVQKNHFMPDVKVEIQGGQGNGLIKEDKVLEVVETIPLTKRELEILKAFANGFTHQEIAEAMFISPHTAKTHLKSIYRKLGINSKVEAVKWIMEHTD